MLKRILLTLALVLGLSVPAMATDMAILHSETTTMNPATSATCTFGGASVSSSSLLVVAVVNAFTSSTPVDYTVSDTLNGTFTKSIYSDNGSQFSSGIWHWKNSGAGTDTITIANSSSNSGFVKIACYEVSNADNAATQPEATNHTDAGSATTGLTPGPVSPTSTSKNFIVAVIVINQSSSLTETDSGWTTDLANTGFAIVSRLDVNGTYNTHWDSSVNTAYWTAIAAFKATGAGGGGGTTNQPCTRMTMGIGKCDIN